MKTNTILSATVQKHGKSTDLIILLHAFNHTANHLVHVRRVILDNFPDADILRPDLPFSRISLADPTEVITDLLTRVDQAYNDSVQGSSTGYQRIILIGHSMGALFARKLYVSACRINEEAPPGPAHESHQNGLQECNPRPWADKVDRIILLAAMNRGWSISHHMSMTKAIIGNISVFLGTIWGYLNGRMPIGFSVRKGAPFITQLRLQWLAMRRSEQKCGKALTIQLLGTIDDVVSPNDNIDLVSGKDFIYLDVPESGHVNIIKMDDTKAGIARSSIFKKALTYSWEDLKKEQLIEEEITNTEDNDVTDVVFVIHGIRDEGYWTHKIARRVMTMGNHLHGRKFASETSSYGYFPMLSFLNPAGRREKVEWLMDQYAEARSRYPKAKQFHYVGHSNGTYLLAKALRDYPACRFHRVVFAGSVVRRHYNWQDLIPNQVEAVLNFVGSQDWVVAYFPKGLQTLNLQDVGSAGDDGFHAGMTHPSVFQPKQYVEGGHSGALAETMWDAIAHFLTADTIQMPDLPESKFSPHKSWYVRYPVWPIIWLLIIAGIGGVFLLILHFSLPEWKYALILVYAFVLWKLVTKG